MHGILKNNPLKEVNIEMIRRIEDCESEIIENMRGGDGCVTKEVLLTPAELYDKGRLYAVLSLEPGASIGYHIHEGEMESYHIIGGIAEYYDGEETVTLRPSDTTLTPDGEGHSIKSIGDVPLVLIAQIIYK